MGGLGWGIRGHGSRVEPEMTTLAEASGRTPCQPGGMTHHEAIRATSPKKRITQLELSINVVQPLHTRSSMPTIHRFANMTIRDNVPDHRPPHVHVVTSDRRDALIDLATLAITSRSLRASDITDALKWIEANRAYATQIFTECNP